MVATTSALVDDVWQRIALFLPSDAILRGLASVSRALRSAVLADTCFGPLLRRDFGDAVIDACAACGVDVEVDDVSRVGHLARVYYGLAMTRVAAISNVPQSDSAVRTVLLRDPTEYWLTLVKTSEIDDAVRRAVEIPGSSHAVAVLTSKRDLVEVNEMLRSRCSELLTAHTGSVVARYVSWCNTGSLRLSVRRTEEWRTWPDNLCTWSSLSEPLPASPATLQKTSTIFISVAELPPWPDRTPRRPSTICIAVFGGAEKSSEVLTFGQSVASKLDRTSLYTPQYEYPEILVLSRCIEGPGRLSVVMDVTGGLHPHVSSTAVRMYLTAHNACSTHRGVPFTLFAEKDERAGRILERGTNAS